MKHLFTRTGSLLLGLLTVLVGPMLAQPVPPDSVKHRLILIGDAGRLFKGRNPVVDAVSARYNLDNSRTTLLYLGDNVYPHGLEDESHPDYDSLTTILGYQARPGLANPGRTNPGRAQPGVGKQSNVLFIPGNHDWGKGKPDGWEKIRRQGHWLDSLHAPNIRLLPAEGCPGPEVVPLDNNLLLVIIDTQWWLHPYEKPGPDSDCACKTEDEVLTRLTDIIQQNKDKGIVLATHQPFRSYGIHGGYYTIKQHIFPLTDFNAHLYIPLPVIGSIYPIARGVFGNIQDLPNPTYQDMIRRMEAAVSAAPNVLFVSGHDHALQHIVDKGRSYIISGSGINRERVKNGKLARFVSGEWGYVVVDHLTNGRVRATFYTVDEAAKATPVYTTDIFTVSPTKERQTGQVASPSFPDSVRVAVAPAYDSVGRFHRWLLGDNYRRQWATPVTFPVFKLTQTNGGFAILQRGGGQQTKSLRLEDKAGREWVLRTVQKAPDQALPDYLRQTIASTILQDQISAANPYAPLAVPTLATAAQVPHATPIYCFIPDDPALGEYRADFANTVCILEERNPGEGKSISTPKVVDALEEDNDNQINQRAVLRARLLDLFIGDWDRHEDQWRWESRKAGKGRIYTPVPRDRDQVFFKGEGPLIKIAGLPWIQPKFQGFRSKLPNVNGFMYNARYFDRLFLAGLSSEDWLETIADFQQAMTDSVLQRAMQQFPPAIRQQTGEEILQTLKARRSDMMEYGMTYYRFLSRTVDIPGTDKTERFRVVHQDDDHLIVSVFKLSKSGAQEQRLYSRVFDAATTEEVRLYGRGGNDEFLINGNQPSRIRVRMIGGGGSDTFRVESPAHHLRPLTVIYDRSMENNVFPSSQQAVIHTSADKAINQYDPHSFKYDRLVPQLTAAYNIDDGVLLGAGLSLTKQGFRKAPFAAQHKLLIGHALATNATFFRYDGILTDLIGKTDLWLHADLRAPNNTQNFFGVGNETDFDRSRRIRHYRTRFNLYTVAALLKRPLGQHAQVAVGPVFQFFSLEEDNNRGRFIETYLNQLPERTSFIDREGYAGYRVNFLIDNRNNPDIPTRGLYWDTNLQGLQALSELGPQLTQLSTDLRVYSSFSKAARFVVANRIGGGATFGDSPFYQLQFLGGRSNLRGFRNYRFAGNSLVYHNIDLRVKLFDFSSFLFPGSVGMTFFNDIGRVWAKGERSAQWHDGYGFGLYVTPIQLLVLNGSVAFSKENTLAYFSLGYRF
ncbi:BamA/TamA family outer membrane protein [Spirosoma sp. KUDC1026]|uniref:BamA/TamA family outer membrane protein n=1 Tax=Spirosoma sp. KUDC1026 TaxID=2745947 RepID=UPI00159B9BEC|nr:BamA/TamA family outer membrane protein [Spirosoma sp. KUDC1026]QKZ14975.1 BamA/TamA family outer membrane protein [Spirosoma sp. KUDC1026]